MTWYFDPTDQTIDVYDHTGSIVADGRPIDGSWSRFPDDVLEIMDLEAVAAFERNDMAYVLQTLRHGAFELIEEGTP